MNVSTENSALLSAFSWVEQLLLGQVGTMIATLAVASLGFLMLAGRLQARRGATVILGCFILFGAGAIANGIVGSLGSAEPPAPVAIAEPVYIPATPRPASNDPYAGASVPDQRTRDILQ